MSTPNSDAANSRVLFSQAKCYRRIVSEYPAPYTEPRDVTEVWVALCDAVEAAQAYFESDDLDPDLGKKYRAFTEAFDVFDFGGAL